MGCEGFPFAPLSQSDVMQNPSPSLLLTESVRYHTESAARKENLYN